MLQTENDMFQVNENFSCLHRKIKLPTPVQEETQCRGEPKSTGLSTNAHPHHQAPAAIGWASGSAHTGAREL